MQPISCQITLLLVQICSKYLAVHNYTNVHSCFIIMIYKVNAVTVSDSFNPYAIQNNGTGTGLKIQQKWKYIGGVWQDEY